MGRFERKTVFPELDLARLDVLKHQTVFKARHHSRTHLTPYLLSFPHPQPDPQGLHSLARPYSQATEAARLFLHLPALGQILMTMLLSTASQT